MNPEQVLARLWQERAVAIIRTEAQETAHRAMESAVRGGFRMVEFTLGCPGAYELIAEWSKRDEITVGVGTVLEPGQAKRAVEAGARFVVSPVTDEAVIATSLDLGVAVMPGAGTATEMARAHKAGAHLQKLFPAPANGPDFVRTLLGPLPFLRLVPTSGVRIDNVAAWFAAGVFGVGFVSSLFDPDNLRRGDFDAIEERALGCIAATRASDRPAGAKYTVPERREPAIP